MKLRILGALLGSTCQVLALKIYTSDLMIKFAEKLEAMLGQKGIQAAEKGENDPAHD